MAEQASDNAKTDQARPEGYGDMTKAWFDAGSEVADFEAGRAAERRRVIFAVVGTVAILGGVVAAIVLLS
ncbi:MAG: hypothetical protein A2289_27045 [Deltaproteobacteria bacterium RIFOXYA12_FULL_58_15]|nr:MAG: hypothetical protein A2289_27045 [Deltaproteobacteria bacterium RIFOXYA12_FULL_58_15]OGR07658.1 MAG: hypothetical protein A2341_21715 [Deltaproteobacteria bacterium RIFOXYB12_FULL_58_9]